MAAGDKTVGSRPYGYVGQNPVQTSHSLGLCPGCSSGEPGIPSEAEEAIDDPTDIPLFIASLFAGADVLYVLEGAGVAAEGGAILDTGAAALPSTLARVIPGEGPFMTLGPAGDVDVFVTDAAAIDGATPAQIAERLTIPPSDEYTIIEFVTPSEGLASPVFRSNPGFIGGGTTAGGALGICCSQWPDSTRIDY